LTPGPTTYTFRDIPEPWEGNIIGNSVTGRAPTAPGEVPTGVGRTFELVIGLSKRKVQGTFKQKHKIKIENALKNSNF
jgi:hypothetical protein